MTKFWKCSAAAFAAFGIAASAQANEGNPRITDITAHMFYEQSGDISEDITSEPDFTGWNVVIGEGSASENVNDVMVMVLIEADEEVYAEAVLSITVRAGENNEVVAQRSIDGLLLDEKTHRAIMIDDAGCMGEITIEAKFGSSVRKETIRLECGE
ncbi:MAG: hypothetical protein ABJP70_08035 [Erythrobacter sp.]